MYSIVAVIADIVRHEAANFPAIISRSICSKSRTCGAIAAAHGGADCVNRRKARSPRFSSTNAISLAVIRRSDAANCCSTRDATSANGSPAPMPSSSHCLPSEALMASYSGSAARREPAGARAAAFSFAREMVLGSHLVQQIDAAHGIAPLIVVPAQYFHHPRPKGHRALGIENTGMRIADDVGRDDLIFGIFQYAF
jgi:hypothetical protein